ncbi:MAG: hypothetical protein ABI673_08760 [Novosphingobium sp.]
MRRAGLLVGLTLAPVMLLAACSEKPDKAAQQRQDPELAGALHEPVMIDPDLSGMNQRGAALTGGGVPEATIPLEEQGSEFAAAARGEALALAGGALQSAPTSTEGGALRHGETPALTARGVVGAGNPCLDMLTYTAAWAARLPAALPIYPRGHVQDAAGADGDHCHVRAINYRVAVTVQDVLDFYATMARKAGLVAVHRADGKAHVLSGRKGTAQYAVIVRAGDEGMAEVDLVTSGF